MPVEIRCNQCGDLELKENVEKVYVHDNMGVPYPLFFCRGSCLRLYLAEQTHLRLATHEEVMQIPSPSYENADSPYVDQRLRRLLFVNEFY